MNYAIYLNEILGTLTLALSAGAVVGAILFNLFGRSD